MSDEKSKNILLLTTKENFVWISMQEIIPEIEACWLGLSQLEENINVDIFNVDDLELSKALKSFLTADLIVFTAFNFKLAKIAERLRKDFSLSTRFVFYLHGMTSLACWPMQYFGMKDVFTKNDLFISTCEKDSETLSLSIEDPPVKVIPFSLEKIPSSFEKFKGDPETPHFVYIGRLSEQKNLHSLIFSFSLLKNKFGQNFKLQFFGKEDQLGSPNMGIPTIPYLEYLQRLTKDLGLTEQISFEGFVEREKLYQHLEDQPYTFISLSLHSDENFGMAALRSLVQGKPAILSDWGGHHEFGINLPEQVTTLPVYKSPRGPFINPLEVAEKIHHTLQQRERSFNAEKLIAYSRAEVTKRLYSEIIEKPQTFQERLQYSELAQNILTNKDQETKIFADYSDPHAHLFFESYGMINSPELISRTATDKSYLCPWVELNENEAVVNDPHRGSLTLQGSKDKLEHQLLELGYLFVD